MLITNHVIAGAAVGMVSRTPGGAFGLGLLSHAAMDALPHWGTEDEETFLRVAVVDGLVGLGVLGYLAVAAPRARRTRVVAGMLGACFPDSDKPSQLFFGRSPFPAIVDKWHGDIQDEATHRLPAEVALGLLGLVAVNRMVRRSAGYDAPRRSRPRP